MGIENKDTGKYTKRPGIYFNEIDKSGLIEPAAATIVPNLVPGFSKKGPVNRPVYVTNPVDFRAIFGNIDKNLEANGSYFHRTVIKMLESGPVYALNLLATDPVRDLAEYQSISVSAQYDNTAVASAPYEYFFNRQDFWERDEDSFLENVVDNPTPDVLRLLHITNVADRDITVFIFKSNNVSNFNVSMSEWYEGITKVPEYLNPEEWVSDYFVRVIVVAGNWTDYNALSVDTTWSTYFTINGLIKTTIDDFVDEDGIVILGDYDVCLIPDFKDKSGLNLFIQDVLNADTDKTGLFVAFKEEVIEAYEYPTGKIDIIGDTLVDSGKLTVDFMSYQTTLTDTTSYPCVYLDQPNNVFGNYYAMSTGNTGRYYDDATYSSRTATYTNFYVSGVTVTETIDAYVGGAVTLPSSNNFIAQSYNLESVSSNGIITYNVFADGGTYTGRTLVNGDIITFNKSFVGIVAGTRYYVQGATTTTFGLSTDVDNFYPVTVTGPLDLGTHYKGYVIYGTLNAGGSNYFTVGGVKTTGLTSSDKFYFDGFQFGTTGHSYSRIDTLYLTKNSTDVSILKGTQVDTTITTPTRHSFPVNSDGIIEDKIILGYAHITTTNEGLIGTTGATGATTNDAYNIANMGEVRYSGVTVDSSGYILYDLEWSTGTTDSNNYLKMTFDYTNGTTDYTDYTQLRARTMFNEVSEALENNQGVIIKRSNGEKLPLTNVQTGPYSTAVDGWIKMWTGTVDPDYYYNYPTFDDDEVLIYYQDSEFIIDTEKSGVTGVQSLSGATETYQAALGAGTISTSLGIAGPQSTYYLGFKNGMFNNGDYFTVNNDTDTSATKIYINSYIDNDILYSTFVDANGAALSIPVGDFPTNYQNTGTTLTNRGKLIIYSNKLNYIQTLEISSFDVAYLPDRVTEIKVDKTRYAEIIRGGFLKAYYNESDYATGGIYEGATPRKMTRIIDTKNDTDPTLKILYTDSPIAITRINSTAETAALYQTTAYPTIEQYISEYKGLRIKPFKISSESIPNGTETRQTSILNVMNTGTNLFKALSNKNKIAFRYMIDSFGLGLTENCKQVYANIGAERLNNISFVNMPSVKTLKKSTDPVFSTDNHSLLSTALLANGGDDTQNPSFYFSLASGKGRSTVGYFFPYVIIDDNGTRVTAPPAAWIATSYMKKFTGTVAGITPWTICAGIVNGKIDGIVKTEMDFNNDDLINLHGMGVNPIVYYIGNGFCINDESTAQVYPQTSLSLLHSREVLIELENRIYNMLLRYQWKLNNAETRGEIAYKADKICKELKDQGGLYDFKNIMDESNNTPYIIYLGMGVLDTYVEIIKGMGVIVNNITILKKGDIASGGFQ